MIRKQCKTKIVLENKYRNEVKTLVFGWSWWRNEEWIDLALSTFNWGWNTHIFFESFFSFSFFIIRHYTMIECIRLPSDWSIADFEDFREFMRTMSVKFVWIRTNSIRIRENSDKFRFIRTNLDLFGQIWSYSDKFEVILTNLNLFGQIWEIRIILRKRYLWN